LADRGYSSFVIGYCLEKPLPPLLRLKMLSQCNGLVFLLLVYEYDQTKEITLSHEHLQGWESQPFIFIRFHMI
jgi:hypothetical protein